MALVIRRKDVKRRSGGLPGLTKRVSRSYALAIIAVLLAGTTACDAGNENAPSGSSPSALPSKSGLTGSASPSESLPSPDPAGRIEGSLSYPSQALPPDLIACAQDVGTGEAFCTHERMNDVRFKYGIGYQIRVPPGTYHVYLSVPETAGPNYRGWWTEYARCGIAPPCDRSENDILDVVVQAGEVVTGVDPEDWYTRNN